MSFIIQGKTNWKFLLIVIILAIIVGGGTLLFMVIFRYPPEPPPNKTDILVDGKNEKLFGITLPIEEGGAINMVQQFCEPKYPSYQYDYKNIEKVNNEWRVKIPNINCICGATINEQTGETKCRADIFSPNETADWKTYKNEEYGFEIKYPETEGISFFKIIVNAEREFLFGTIVCMEGEETTVLEKIRLSPYIEVAASSFEELGRQPTEEECDTLASRYVISGRFCTNKNLTKYQAYCEEGSETSDYHRYDVFLACDGENFNGKEGRIRCNQIFNQMLSTFRFIE